MRGVLFFFSLSRLPEERGPKHSKKEQNGRKPSCIFCKEILLKAIQIFYVQFYKRTLVLPSYGKCFSLMLSWARRMATGARHSLAMLSKLLQKEFLLFFIYGTEYHRHLGIWKRNKHHYVVYRHSTFEGICKRKVWQKYPRKREKSPYISKTVRTSCLHSINYVDTMLPWKFLVSSFPSSKQKST